MNSAETRATLLMQRRSDEEERNRDRRDLRGQGQRGRPNVYRGEVFGLAGYEYLNIESEKIEEKTI